MKAKKEPIKANKSKAKKSFVKVTESEPTTNIKAKKIKVLKKEGTSPRPAEIPEENHSVRLPSILPVSTVNKAYDLRKELDVYISRSVQKVAYVSAFCFMAVGSTLSLLSVAESNHEEMFLTAQILDSRNIATEVKTLEVEQEFADKTAFEYLSKFPSNVTDELKVNFKATNVETVRVKLVSAQHSGFFELTSSPMLEDKFRTVIKASAYPVGYYKLIVYLIPEDGTGIKAYSSEEFFLGSSESESQFGDRYSDTDESGSVREDDKEPVPENENEEEEEEAKDETTDSSAQKLTKEPEAPVLQIKSTKGREVSGIATIGLSYPKDLSFVELYSRPINSTEYRFITLATKRLGNWVFEFDTKNLPDSKYELIAKSVYEGEEIESSQIVINVSNKTVKEESTSVLPRLENGSSTEDRYLETSYDNSTLESSELNNVSEETLHLLEKNRLEMDRLMKGYSSAVQSDDKLLIDVARKELDKKREEMVKETLDTPSLQSISDDIDAEIKTNLNNLMSRVDKFENLRREKSSNDVSTDTDEDGISDFDEINFFETDPKSADTDNDGFTDGIEILKGYDPNNSVPESTINFESPKDFKNLERNDVINIESVIPIITKSSELSPIRAEIKGKSLPNSFVTLYIFSSPTVITIKTDPDGSFVYTFDRELEDGEHEVFAAITDNTGSIMAQSKVFGFVKTAEAFTPVSAIDGQAVPVTSSDSVTEASYKTVLGMAILVLGVILLMLGIGLRMKDSTTEPELQTLAVDKKEIASTSLEKVTL